MEVNFKIDADVRLIRLPEDYPFINDFLYIKEMGGIFAVAKEDVDTVIIPNYLSDFLKASKVTLSEVAINTFVYTSNITVELKENPDGIKFEELRRQLKHQKYFIDNQPFVFKNRDTFIGLIQSSENIKNFYIDDKTIIKFKGDNVVTIEQVAGLKDVKQWLDEEYLFCVRNKELINKWGLTIPTGLLLYGPPGNGKTYFAKALSAELGTAFFILNSSEAISSSAGDGDKQVMKLFEDARKVAPAIIFIDEVEALCLTRKETNSGFENRIATVLLNEMDGMTSNDGVLVIGATNKPEMVDFAFKRAGRFSYHIKIDNPSQNDIEQLTKIRLKKYSYDSENFDNIVNYLKNSASNYSMSKITEIIKRAGLSALRENTDSPKIELKHIKNTIDSYLKYETV